MEVIDSNLILEKNKLAGDEPWLIALDVQLTTSDYAYLVRNNEDITFDSRTYQAFPLEIDERNQVSQGEIPTLGIRVSNINRLVQNYLEDYGGLVDNEVTLRILSRVGTTWTEAISFTYKVLACVADSMWVNFTLGAPNPLNRRFPLYRYISNHCNWKFGSSECNYTFNPVGTWTASRLYWAGDLVRASEYFTSSRPDMPPNNYTFRCIKPGISSTIEPTWSTVTAAYTVEDAGPVLWQESSLTTWTASRKYFTGDIVHCTTTTYTNYYRALNEGTSGSQQPNWPSRLGATILDGTVAAGITWTVNTCKRSLGNCRDLNMSINFGGHPGLSGKGMKVVT